jgi:hypothetical protein
MWANFMSGFERGERKGVDRVLLLKLVEKPEALVRFTNVWYCLIDWTDGDVQSLQLYRA